MHNNLKEVKKAKKYDLVLSPQFYIVKREQLPVKYAFQAKKLAPSVLEDLLVSNYGYEFIVQKDGDGWLFFAYRPKEIENFLKGCCGIEPYKIGKIYFADQLKKALSKIPIGIDERYALSLIDGFATIVPRSMLDSQRYIKFSSKLRPKIGFKFKSSRKVGRESAINKNAIIASILMLLLATAYTIEGIDYKKARDSSYSKIDEATANYPQLKSKLTRDSIKSKYSKIEKRQRAIRDTIELFSQLSSKKTLLDNLELTKDAIKATFSVDKKELNRFKSIVANAKLKIVSQRGNTITIQGDIKWVKIF